MAVSSGILQDNTPGEQYDRVMLMIMVFKAFDTFMGPLYDYLDGRWLGHQLRLPERKRRDALLQKELAGRTFEGHKRSSQWTYIGIGALSGMVIAGWVVSTRCDEHVCADDSSSFGMLCLIDSLAPEFPELSASRMDTTHCACKSTL